MKKKNYILKSLIILWNWKSYHKRNTVIIWLCYIPPQTKDFFRGWGVYLILRRSTNIFSYGRTFESLTSKLFNDLRVCYNFDPLSFLQVQCHRKEKYIIRGWSLLLFITKHWLKFPLHIKITHDLWVCHDFDPFIVQV